MPSTMRSTHVWSTWKNRIDSGSSRSASGTRHASGTPRSSRTSVSQVLRRSGIATLCASPPASPVASVRPSALVSTANDARYLLTASMPEVFVSGSYMVRSSGQSDRFHVAERLLETVDAYGADVDRRDWRRDGRADASEIDSHVAEPVLHLLDNAADVA